ncbi:MAG TPA: hypothetical protein PLS07_03140 [Niabella sp.]|nr:hypothetical protein [Niabella sp.]HQW14093.1 hypothetical protein [Niabella sp.]HQX19364.1 hypothetical protein [Niabella sp.]HQX41778.1 hypothetical protein [Niabella sp.]HRB05581.1 hypothetical protein [Niabella sp.]
MNSQKKIYDLECTPPAGVWNKISKELDEIDSLKNLSQKLNNSEAIPPAFAWEQISSQLEMAEQEKNLSQKLYHSEATPPNLVWDKICCELDDQQALDIIEKKLKDIQVKPPASVWNSIERELNNTKHEEAHKGLVVPMHHHGWLKYAAAACFIAIISFTAYFIFDDGENSSSDIAANTQVDNSSISQITSSDNGGVHNNASNSPSSHKEKAMAAISTKLGNVYSISSEKNADLQNRYIVLMTPDGNIVRMSKKLGNMADCIAGEDNSCNEQISEWQKEMASSTSITAPDNFLDILDMASNEKVQN